MNAPSTGYSLVLSLVLTVGLLPAVADAQPADSSSVAQGSVTRSGRTSGRTWAGDFENPDESDLLDQIQPGERIRVRLKNGARLQGEVIGLLGDRIQLEISHERMTMSGTITLRSDRIASITKLDALSPSERRQIQAIKEQYQANVQASGTDGDSTRNESDTAGSREESASGEAQSEGGDAKQKNQEEQGTKNQESKQSEEGPPELTAEQRGLLDRFPEDEWTQSRYQKLKSKYGFQRNSQQDAFIENWEELQRAREIQNKKKQYQLLQEFHPDDGWTPEKYRHIKEDLAALEAKGIPARSPQQRKFLQVYDQWKEAYERYKKRKKKKKETDGQTKPGSSGSESQNPKQKQQQTGEVPEQPQPPENTESSPDGNSNY